MEKGKEYLWKFRLMVLLCLFVSFLGITENVKAAERFLWPVPNYTNVSQSYSSGHPAIDISQGGIAGKPVVATKSGIVVAAKDTCSCGDPYTPCTCNGRQGNYVIIKHYDGGLSRYLHLQYGSVSVRAGQSINRGAQIGLVGSSGESYGYHLHFDLATGSVWDRNNRYNPMTESYDYNNTDSTVPTNPNSNPEGCLDSVTSNTPGTITLKGWAFDRSSLGTSLEIHVYVGGAYNGSALYGTSIRADKVRGDVNNVYPGVGNNHGFDETINVPVSPGTYPVYVYAINVGGSTGSNYNTCLGSKTVTIKSDSTPPEIYDVRVTDLNESGYTVTCTVTDDQDVNRVQFPTWTAMNDQDDIDGNWWSSERSRGRRNGNNYTFRVNISDHNNEFGVYYTHIYAFDSAGNYKSVCVDGQVVSKYSANPGRTINDGVYSIRSRVDSGFELAVNGNANEAGANIYLWSRDVQNPYHRFKFTYKADGYYLITNMGSGLALDVCGGSSANNTNIMQYTVHGDSNQLFRIYPDENNAYYIVPKNAPYSCIDLANGNASNGNNIQLFQENHSNAQRWYLTDYSTGVSNGTVETPEESEEIEQVAVKPKETVLISLKNSRSKKLQVKWKRNSNVNGYKVQIATNSVFSNSVTYTVNGNKTTSKIFNVKKGKTYWVRICTCRGDMISNWSKAKKIKIRK